MAEVMDSIRSFFQQISAVFAELWFWPVVMIGLMLLAVIVMSFLVKYSYENRILKSVNKLNKYFLSKPFITEENLVEFNLKMKKVPKVLRTNWQIFMLNREDPPTKYINVNTCIDKPLRTSSIEKNMSNYTVFTILLIFLSFITGLQYANVLAQYTVTDALFTACLVPMLLVVIYTVFILAVRASKNDIYACLYENFPLYERNLTKAVTTLPSYVDYEILFTKQEIKEGIPILQQYLEKRALVEQQELEKARENSVATEEYDFSDLGIDGSLILERSMKESEIFIKIRRRLEEEINSIETEKENYRKNYEETVKDMQRKLQASRENLESLKTQQEQSTNRIESNYIRKQQADEIKKQQQLEKDVEEATAKFNDEQISLQQEIDKRQKEIEEKREFVQQAMVLEFKHYANTLYKALTQKATEVGNQKLLTLAQENSDLKALLTDIQGVGGGDESFEENKNLIQNDDLTAENLYEMSSTDMENLEDGRETSKQAEIEEDKKIEEKAAQEEKKSETETNSEGQSETQAENKEEDVKEEVDVDSKEDSNVDEKEKEEIEDIEEDKEESKGKEEKEEREDKGDKKAKKQEIDEEEEEEEVPKKKKKRLEDDEEDDDYPRRDRHREYDNPPPYGYNQGYYPNDPNYMGYNQGYYQPYPDYQGYNDPYYNDPYYQQGYQGYNDPYYNDAMYNNYVQQPNMQQQAPVQPMQQPSTSQQIVQPTQIVPSQQENVNNASPQANTQNVASQQVQNDDLAQIQKQIDEESNRLQKEKQEFENDINNTISKMDAQETTQKEEVKEEANEKASDDEIDKQEEVLDNDDNEKSEIDEISSIAKPRKERQTSRRNRGRKPTTRAKSNKASAEIDELNAEMQKLLDSAKGNKE